MHHRSGYLDDKLIELDHLKFCTIAAENAVREPYTYGTFYNLLMDHGEQYSREIFG